MSKKSLGWSVAVAVAAIGIVVGVVASSGGYSGAGRASGPGGYGNAPLASAPSAPRSVTAVAGSASATVKWTAPVSNGGARVSEYVVAAIPSGASCSSAATTCTVTGLTNGRSYSFTVVAQNRAGSSTAARSSASVTPRGSTSRTVLTVTPSTGLTDGSSVKVAGDGFTPGDRVVLVECLTLATSQTGCDVATATPATISSSGRLPATSFRVVTGTVGSGFCGTKTSNLSACAVSVGNASGGDTAVAPITFR